MKQWTRSVKEEREGTSQPVIGQQVIVKINKQEENI